MRRKYPCFAATDDQLIASGLQPDRHGLKQGLWESSMNVLFANGAVRRKLDGGLAFTIAGGAPVRGIGQLHASDGQRWLWAGAAGQIWRWEFGAAEEIVGAFGTYRADQNGTLQPTIYDFTPYGDWMIFNDGIQAIRFKPGSPNSLDIGWTPDVPTGVVKFIKVMNMIMACGYGERGTQVGWCDPDNIDIWTAAADNLAGSLAVDDFDTPIRAAEKLGTQIAVYGEMQMAFIRYIGGTGVWGFQPGLTGIGATGKAAVATDTRVNVGFSRRGAWWTDGNSFRYIDEGFIRQYLQANVNWDQAGKVNVCYNDITACFEFRFPMRGSLEINEGWSFDPKSGSWSPISFDGSFCAPVRLFQNMLRGSVGGNVLFDDFGPAVGSPLALSTKPLLLQEPDGSNRGTHVISYVDELELWLKAASNVQVRVGCCDDPNGAWEWDSWQDVTAGSHLLELGKLPDNPLWKVQFQSTAGHDADWDFDLQGLLLYGPSIGTKLDA